MKTLTAKNSTKMVCGALLASVMTMTDVASAAPGLMNVRTFPSINGGASPIFSDFNANHQFGGAPTIVGGFYSLTITSNLSTRPGWQYDLLVDYANFGTTYFAGGGFTFVVQITGITDPAGSISAVNIKDAFGQNYLGAVVTNTANSIEVRISADSIIAGGDWMTIQWAVPAPGALALLGMAGMVGSRRRRA